MEAVKQSPSRAIIINPSSPLTNVETSRASGWQLGAKRAVDARATLLWRERWCKTQNADEACPWASFRGRPWCTCVNTNSVEKKS